MAPGTPPGADGVWIGTRFMASQEARTAPGVKEHLLQTTSRDTVITAAYTGKPCRVIKNKYGPHDTRTVGRPCPVLTRGGAAGVFLGSLVRAA